MNVKNFRKRYWDAWERMVLTGHYKLAAEMVIAVMFRISKGKKPILPSPKRRYCLLKKAEAT
jgi:hypothetical protein